MEYIINLCIINLKVFPSFQYMQIKNNKEDIWRIYYGHISRLENIKMRARLKSTRSYRTTWLVFKIHHHVAACSKVQR